MQKRGEIHLAFAMYILGVLITPASMRFTPLLLSYLYIVGEATKAYPCTKTANGEVAVWGRGHSRRGYLLFVTPVL